MKKKGHIFLSAPLCALSGSSPLRPTWGSEKNAMVGSCSHRREARIGAHFALECRGGNGSARTWPWTCPPGPKANSRGHGSTHFCCLAMALMAQWASWVGSVQHLSSALSNNLVISFVQTMQNAQMTKEYHFHASMLFRLQFSNNYSLTQVLIHIHWYHDSWTLLHHHLEVTASSSSCSPVFSVHFN